MRLTRLQLSGFKSFADTVELTFDDGVTAIVGPNGCGKSNISDAVRWVLGEQRARMLRGDRMDDIIFQGAAKRKPLNVAEISLHLDNSDGTLPLSYREVVVTRRLSRSGQSEYLINQQSVRLRDGDKIQIGDTILKYVVLDSIEANFHAEVRDRISYDQLTGLLTKESLYLAFERQV